MIALSEADVTAGRVVSQKDAFERARRSIEGIEKDG